jgi:hypothetical protein
VKRIFRDFDNHFVIELGNSKRRKKLIDRLYRERAFNLVSSLVLALGASLIYLLEWPFPATTLAAFWSLLSFIQFSRLDSLIKTIKLFDHLLLFERDAARTDRIRGSA